MEKLRRSDTSHLHFSWNSCGFQYLRRRYGVTEQSGEIDTLPCMYEQNRRLPRAPIWRDIKYKLLQSCSFFSFHTHSIAICFNKQTATVRKLHLQNKVTVCADIPVPMRTKYDKIRKKEESLQSPKRPWMERALAL